MDRQIEIKEIKISRSPNSNIYDNKVLVDVVCLDGIQRLIVYQYPTFDGYEQITTDFRNKNGYKTVKYLDESLPERYFGTSLLDEMRIVHRGNFGHLYIEQLNNYINIIKNAPPISNKEAKLNRIYEKLRYEENLVINDIRTNV